MKPVNNDEKITIGRRFSKREISSKKFLRVTKGLVPERCPQKAEQFQKRRKEETFDKFLEQLKTIFIHTLQVHNLPTNIFWYPSGGPLGGQKWQPEPPEGLPEEEALERRITLDNYLIFLGLRFDSLEHLAGQGLFLIYTIRATKDEEIIRRASFRLGRIFQLSSVYLDMSLEGAALGRRKRTNPWFEYAAHLQEKYPNKTQEYILRKIPEEPNHEICGNWSFYRKFDPEKTAEFLVA